MHNGKGGLGNDLIVFSQTMLLAVLLGRKMAILDDPQAGIAKCYHNIGTPKEQELWSLLQPKSLGKFFHSNLVLLDAGAAASPRFRDTLTSPTSRVYLLDDQKSGWGVDRQAGCMVALTREMTSQSVLDQIVPPGEPVATVLKNMGSMHKAVAVQEHAVFRAIVADTGADGSSIRGCMLRLVLQAAQPRFAELLRPYLDEFAAYDYIGIHIRVGDRVLRPASESEQSIHGKNLEQRLTTNPDRLMACLRPWLERAHKGLRPDRIRYFLAADSQAVALALQARLGASRTLLTKGVPVHSLFAKSAANLTHQSEEDGLAKIMLDWTLLARSRRLVASYSTFSLLAAAAGLFEPGHYLTMPGCE